MNWQHEIDELKLKRRLAQRMGGPEGIERQHSQGRLTVRERIDLLFDEGSFEEHYSLFGESQYDAADNLTAFRPGNTIAGYGRINGRIVAMRGDDYTIRGGASDGASGGKRDIIEQAAGGERVPLVKLLEGAGGSIATVAQNYKLEGAPAGSGPRLHAVNEGVDEMTAEVAVPGSRSVSPVWEPEGIPAFPQNDPVSLMARGNLLATVPVVSAVLGSCAGIIAIQAVDSHFSVMLKDTSEIFVGGPPLIREAYGVDISKQDLGNYRIACQLTGAINNVATDEADAFAQIRRFLSYLPQNVWQLPARTAPEDDPNRREEFLTSVIPADRRKTFDVRRVIGAVADKGSTFEMSALFGRPLITMFARIDGFPVALLANDCRYEGGAQTAAACQKLERFIDLADTFHLPVVYLCDVPGFAIGLAAEREGTIRWAVRSNEAVVEARVPYVTVILRRFYGVARHSSKNDYPGINVRYAWPSMESGSIPAAGGVAAAFRRELASDPDGEQKRLDLEDRLNKMASVMRQTRLVDEIIDPRDTRPLLVDFVRRAQSLTATQLGPKLRVGIRP